LRWLARYVDDEGKERSKSFRTKVEANAWLDNTVSSLVSGNYVDPRFGKVTFASFYKEWSSRQVWVQGTRNAMDLAARSVTFGDVPFVDLRPSHAESWVKKMLDDGLQPSTIKTRFVNVRGAIRAAVRDRMLSRDVTINVKLPRQRKAEAAMAIPTPAEVGRLLTFDDRRARTFIAVCAFAGLRLGEAAALQVGDIDFLRREIKINRQVQRATGSGVEIRAPKYGSERTVYAPDGLLELLSEHLRDGVLKASDKTSWLFEGERGNPWHQNTVGYFWRRARTHAEIDYKLHDLRHFFASGLIRAGCDVVTVQRALGHSNASVTLKTYSHLWPDANDRTRKAAALMFDESLGIERPAATADQLRTED
jgi:integrase